MRAHGSPQAGFTYLGILFAVALMGLLLTLAARVWTLTEQREREEQLLWVGDSMRLAIANYYAHGHRYPNSLKDLLVDSRSPVPVHYLRRSYLDPITNQDDWQLVPAPEGGFKGVYSPSTLAPIKRQNFSEIDKGFTDRDRYSDWQFIYEPRLRRWGVGVNPPTPGSPGGPAAPAVPPGTTPGAPGVLVPQ